MANLNKVFLIGNLTRDPQLAYTPNQTAVVDFGIATNRKWQDKEGTSREEVCFIDCRAFGKPAETLNRYVGKGQLIFFEGRLCFEQWTAQDGTKRSKHRVTIEKFQFLPSGNNQSQSQDGGANPEYDENYAPPVEYHPSNAGSGPVCRI